MQNVSVFAHPSCQFPLLFGTHEYPINVGDMTPEIISGSLRISDKAASGRPQLATGPQKCVPTRTRNEIRLSVTDFEDEPQRKVSFVIGD